MYFPRPYCDEVLGSVVGRAVRHHGLTFRTLLTHVLLRSDATNLSFFMPSGLQRLEQLTGYSKLSLIASHTPLFYWAAYAKPSEMRRILSTALAEGQSFQEGPRKHVKTAWMRYTRLRFCAECLASDIKRHGESYWHRSHFLPTVPDCPIHGCGLQQDPQQWSERRAFRLLPQDLQESVPVPRPTCLVACQKLADASLRPIQGDWQHRDSWEDLYRTHAVRLGYLRTSGSVAAVQLAADLQALFGAEYLASIGCHLGPVAMRAWPVRLLQRSVQSNISAPKHLLLHCFLEMSSGPGPRATRKTGPKERPIGEVDASLASAIQQRWEEARLCAERLTVRALLVSLGAWSVVRRKRSELPITTALLQAFRRSNQWKAGGRRSAARFPSTPL